MFMVGVMVGPSSLSDAFGDSRSDSSPTPWLALAVILWPAFVLLVFSGYLHPKPREICFYGLLIWLPKLTKALPEIEQEVHALPPGLARMEQAFLLILMVLTMFVPYFGLVLRRYEKPPTPPPPAY